MVVLILSLLAVQALGDAPPSCGIAEIDGIRRDAARTPTDASTLLSRRTALHRWWRLLWHQGYDLSDHNDTWDTLNDGGTSPEARRTVDDGYRALERVMKENRRIGTPRGKADPSSTKTDWPVYHGTDGRQTGFSPDAGPSVGEIAWKVAKGNFWNAAPVIENGRIYLASPGADVIAYCLEEKTGAVIWKGRQYGEQIYTTPGAIFTPVVTADRVLMTTGWWQPQTHFVLDKANGFFRSRIDSMDGDTGATDAITAFKYFRTRVVIADARTGEGIWHTSLGGHIAGEPVVSKGQVFAAQQEGWVFGFLDVAKKTRTWQTQVDGSPRGSPCVGPDTIYVGDSSRQLHALDRSTGAVKWRFQAPEVENKAYQYFSTAAEADERVYVATAAGILHCLDAASGEAAWKIRLGEWIRSRPRVLGRTVFVSSIDGTLHAVRDNGDSAEITWRRRLNEHGFTADLVGTREGILASGRDLVLYSVAPETGRIQWRHSILDGAWVDGVRHRADVYAGQYQTSPTAVDGKVYIGGPDGFLFALDAETGKRLWRFETQGRISSVPCVAEGRVYVGKNSHLDEFYALDKDTGEPVWTRKDIGWASVGATAYANGRIFIGTVEGKMFALNAATGRTDWVFDAGQGKGIYPHPATDDTYVYTGSHNGHYYAFDQTTGDVAWKVFTANPGGNGGDPDSAAAVLWKNHLYVQKRGDGIAALDRNSGREEWSWRQPANYLQNGTVAAFDGKVFGSVVRLVTAVPYYGAIYAFSDVEGGSKRLWTYDEAGGGGGLTAPVAAKGKLIFGSSSSVYVTCLDPDNGTLIWRCYVGGPMEEGVPAIYGDKVYVHCRNGFFFAIR